MNRLCLICSAMTLAVLLGGCGSSQVVPAVQQFASLSVSIEASEESIRVGGATILTITAKNNTSEVIDFGQGSSSCWFGIHIAEAGSGQYLSFSRRCTADMVYRSLAPGEEHSERVTWFGNTLVGDEYVNVPPGAYEIRGVARNSESPSVVVSVSE